MDFTLDTDFGKMSSFNIDMSDFDVSSPFKKDQKSKETSKEESNVVVNKKKGDGFNFSFDFEYVLPIGDPLYSAPYLFKGELCFISSKHDQLFKCN